MYRSAYITALLAALIFSCATDSTVKLLRQPEYLFLQGDISQIDRIVAVLLENSEASRDAAFTLGRLGDARATPYLVQVIREEGIAEKEAIVALGMLQDTRAVPDLIQIVKLNKPLAPDAVRVLGILKDRRATPMLMKVVDEERPYSLLAIEALGEMGDIQAVDLLVTKFKQTTSGRPENIQFRVLRQGDEKQHILTFDLPPNLPSKIDIIGRMMEPEGHALFRYRLKDTELDSLAIIAEYSVNDGINWHPASTEGNITDIVENDYQGSIVWRVDRDIDLTALQLDPSFGLLLRLTPVDKHPRPRRGVPDTWKFAVDTTSIDIQDIKAEEEGDVFFPFYYPNPARASLDSFVYHYTIDNGINWSPATVRLGTIPENEEQDSMSVIWSSDIDLPNKDIDEVQFRVSANTRNTYGKYDITSPFHLDNNTVPLVEFLDFNEDKDGLFHIGYRISDVENDTVSLNLQYSTDEGRTWKQTTVSGNLLNLSPDKYTGVARWFAEFDITEFRDTPIRLRLRPADRDPGLFVDSRDFYLKNADFTKITQGLSSGLVELSYSISQDDTTRPFAQYSLDRGRTWHNASLPDITLEELQNKRNVTINWDMSEDITSYLKHIESIGSSIEKIQEPAVVPELLQLSRQKTSPYREMRQQAVEATRILERKSPWVIEGLINSLVHPDEDIRSVSLGILQTVDTPEVNMAITDYEHHWTGEARTGRENVSFENEYVEQLYQENLRKPRPINVNQVISNIMRWWGMSRFQAASFIKDIDVLKDQTILNREIAEGRITDDEYWTRLERLLREARERRLREQRERQERNNGLDQNAEKK